MENKQLTCPKCGSDNVFAKGTKGAGFRTFLEAFGLDGLLRIFSGNTTFINENPQRIQSKCKKCGNIFYLEMKSLESQEELKTDCKIILYRGKRMVGALMPFYVYLNSKKVGEVYNGKSIEFTTNLKSNTLNVTDTVGNAFKDTYQFNAVEDGKIKVYFDRKFIRNYKPQSN